MLCCSEFRPTLESPKPQVMYTYVEVKSKPVILHKMNKRHAQSDAGLVKTADYPTEACYEHTPSALLYPSR